MTYRWPEWWCAECGKGMRSDEKPAPIWTEDEEAWCSGCARPDANSKERSG